jgi:TIR domain
MNILPIQPKKPRRREKLVQMECNLKLSSVPMSEKKIRLFLSHASEDKDDFVRPLHDRLENEGFVVWYDEDSLIVGRSLLGQISQGLKSSDFGVVVLSPRRSRGFQVRERYRSSGC